uniref:Uncharacterized protein n=1 Tax=Tanacetum cinerariifolium TaxID=118510 RepID=A0A699LB51_TANCI|nr:hypothetical protein [Tanacetum cinerariifolium]
MERYNLQDQANDPKLWDVLKRKFKKSSTSNTSCMDDAFRIQHHDDHQEDDATLEGKKRAKRQKTSKSSKSARGSSSKQLASSYVSKCKQQQQDWDAWVDQKVFGEDEYGNTKEKSYILSLYKIHVVLFPEKDLEEKMNHWVQKEFKTFNEEARLLIQHWKDSCHKIMYKLNQRKVRDNPEEYFSNHRIVTAKVCLGVLLHNTTAQDTRERPLNVSFKK